MATAKAKEAAKEAKYLLVESLNDSTVVVPHSGLVGEVDQDKLPAISVEPLNRVTVLRSIWENDPNLGKMVSRELLKVTPVTEFVAPLDELLVPEEFSDLVPEDRAKAQDIVFGHDVMAMSLINVRAKQRHARARLDVPQIKRRHRLILGLALHWLEQRDIHPDRQQACSDALREIEELT